MRFTVNLPQALIDILEFSSLSITFAGSHIICSKRVVDCDMPSSFRAVKRSKILFDEATHCLQKEPDIAFARLKNWSVESV